MQGTSSSELAAELRRSARVCEEAAAACARREGSRELVSSLLLAAAAMQTALRALDSDSGTARASLVITSTLAGDAVTTAERHGLDPALLPCVAACRRVMELCA